MKKMALFTFSLILFACKKHDTPACGVSQAGLSGSYQLTALQYQAAKGDAPQDYLTSMDACEKDNILILHDDGSYDYNDVGTVCSPDESLHGTWQVKGNTLTSDGILNGTVASYDCKTLIYYIDNAITPGDRLTYTMVKQ